MNPDRELLQQRVDQLIRERLNGSEVSQESATDSIIQGLIDLNNETAKQGEPESKKPKLEHSSDDCDNDDLGSSHPATVKEMVLYTLENCSEEDLKGIRVHYSDDAAPLKSIDYNNRKDFEAAIKEYDSIKFFLFQETYFNNLGDSGALQVRLFPKLELASELKRLFGNTNTNCEEDVFINNLVLAENAENAQFPEDLEKGYAVVISGESGSGKSWFAKRSLPLKHPDASFIYYEIRDEDVKEVPDWSANNVGFGKVYTQLLKDLNYHGLSFTPVYSAVSELSRQNNAQRNKVSRVLFEKWVIKALEESKTAKNWWQTPDTTLEKLVIIIDEVGKLPELARGLVDEVRHISINIRNKGLAKKIMIVLVGSGLDYYIDDDSISFATKTPADEDFLSSLASFGTDPFKSRLIVLRQPNLNRYPDIHDVSVADILKGTYSRVLATNTRMLFHGVIEVMKLRMHMLCVDDGSRSSRRVELGSTNIVMDYTARIYTTLNGLDRMEGKDKEHVLLKQFLLLLHVELDGKSKNPALNAVAKAINEVVLYRDYMLALKLGIITARIKTTSPALRYLACKGQTAPLDAQDGIAFEIVVQHHLVRYMKALHDAGDPETQESPNYYCERYNLGQPWPPSSTKGDSNLGDKEVVEKEVKARYEAEKKKGRREDNTDDAEAIAKLVQDKSEYDLVMRQTVSNVQGADLMVLSKRKCDEKVSLDLYQAKHYDTIPSGTSHAVVAAFASLGVKYNTNATLSFETTVETGAAGYSYVGTQRFVQELAEKLKRPVEVRNRVLVFSKPWAAVNENPTWNEFPFSSAKEKNVWVWTAEVLQPTISALVLSKTHVLPEE